MFLYGYYTLGILKLWEEEKQQIEEAKRIVNHSFTPGDLLYSVGV